MVGLFLTGSLGGEWIVVGPGEGPRREFGSYPEEDREGARVEAGRQPGSYGSCEVSDDRDGGQGRGRGQRY